MRSCPDPLQQIRVILLDSGCTDQAAEEFLQYWQNGDPAAWRQFLQGTGSSCWKISMQTNCGSTGWIICLTGWNGNRACDPFCAEMLCLFEPTHACERKR